MFQTYRAFRRDSRRPSQPRARQAAQVAHSGRRPASKLAVNLWPVSERLVLLDRGEETAMYNILIMKIGDVLMTRRIDILKIIAVAATIGVVFYFLAHRGL